MSKNMTVKILRTRSSISKHFEMSSPYVLWGGDASELLSALPDDAKFDLIVTSPPYNIGKPYEKKVALDEYLKWQRQVIEKLVAHLSPTGSLCWQVGNYVHQGEITPLDFEFHPIFREFGLQLRNRIVWRFGHGLHNSRRFSGRYEVVLWYTKSKDYHFDLDAVRIDSKYPGKKHYKGPKAGEYSSNPGGKNPEDVWDADQDIWNIPNVKSNHVEKTAHPCQFPIGLIERLVLALTPKEGTVFDPFAGVGSAGAAAAMHGRGFWGCELDSDYIEIARKRIEEALDGTLRYRPHSKPIYDHTKSNLSKRPALI